MACTTSVLRPPFTGDALPVSCKYDCAGSAEAEVLAHDVSIVPGTKVPAFGFRFSPTIMAGHSTQHLAECEASAVICRPEGKARWLPLFHLDKTNDHYRFI